MRFFPVVLSCALVAAGEEPPLNDPARQVVESELAFAHKCSEIGISKSFTQFFAGDAVVFVKGPTNGKKYYAKYKDQGRKLIWQPIFATASTGGDLGVTSGPWQLSKSANEPKPIAFGQFASIWKKQPDKSWKVVLDVGSDNPQPTQEPTEIEFLPPDTGSFDAKLARDTLNNADKSLADTMKDGAAAAIILAASDHIRVLRDGTFPAVGKDAAKLMLSGESGASTRKIMGGSIATSCDLAYRYGSFVSQRGNNKVSGNFLCVWRLERGEWRIILDLQKKAAPKK